MIPKINYIGPRIKQIREVFNLKQQPFAKELGLSVSYISELESNKYSPGAEFFISVYRRFKVDPVWLLTGEGPMLKTEEKQTFAVCEKPGEPYGLSADYVLVPQVSGEISAGGGLEPDNTIEMRIAFRRDWIQRKGDPRNMSMIRVSGDSMEPTLVSGDLVLVDHNRNFLDPQGGIYAIVLDNHIMIKRLQLLHPAKSLKIISDNSRYEPIEVGENEIQVNGKVVWYGRELER